MEKRALTALPVFNEVDSVDGVLDEVLKYSESVLVVDDGSSDGTTQRLNARADKRFQFVRHFENRGYGAALQTAFQYAQDHDYHTIVTVDCDGQHEPRLIPDFVRASDGADIVSGSRYLEASTPAMLAPEDRRRINHTITTELNKRFAMRLTDAFCGFKAYRVEALRRLQLSENGYAMPLELWVQAAFLDLEVNETAVPLIYLDANRSFGEALDDSEIRLAHYRQVIEASVIRAKKLFRGGPTLCGEVVG